MKRNSDSISLRDARRLFLNRQGLIRQAHFGRGKRAVVRAVDDLSYLQIDTISVVERAHHHVLKTRIENYVPEMLNELQVKDRKLFEYWAHAAAYLPIEDYRYYLPIMEGSAIKRKPDSVMAPEILRKIRDEGPLQSTHFEDPEGRKSNGWWDWKPAKRVLEQLFLTGELMVVARDGFRKIYDLRENVLPNHINTTRPTDIEWCEFLVNRRIGAMGIATEYDIGYIRTAIRQLAARNIKALMQKSLSNLLEQEVVIPVTVNGITCYSHAETLEQLPVRSGTKRVRILSPFDNSVINRRRTMELFNFNYQLECYLPEKKRQYGYFCLPILYGDELIGRMDTKAIRSKGELLIRNIVLEPQIKITDQLMYCLGRGITVFAIDNHCTAASISRASPSLLGNLELM